MNKMAATVTKRKLPREVDDNAVDTSQELLVSTPASDDGGSSDEDTSFDESGSGGDSGSSEEDVYYGSSDISDEDDIGEIVTLKGDPWAVAEEEEESSGGSEESDEEGGNEAEETNMTKEAISKRRSDGDILPKKQTDTERSKKMEQIAALQKVTNEDQGVGVSKSSRRRQRRREKKIAQRELNKQNDEKSTGVEGQKKDETDTVIEGSGPPPTDISGGTAVADEYEFDSSDEEDIRNTVGNIPMEWYRGFDHIGYNVKGEKIIKPPTRDELDEFLNKVDNPDYWRTVFDSKNGEDIVLSDEDLDIIRRIQRGGYPDATVDPYEPYSDFFTHETMIHPLTRFPDHKRSFIPSLTEKAKVSRYLDLMRRGIMKPSWEKDRDKEKAKAKDPHYDIWKADENDPTRRRHIAHIAAPKVPLPGHSESYRPPPEYILPDKAPIDERGETPEGESRLRFTRPQYDSLRKVPFYPRYFHERFSRCLDLYLCPRQRVVRNRLDADDILPQLPKPKDLQPFPTTLSLLYSGHTSYVRSISVDPSGQWLVSGSDDKTVRFWEVSTGRCLKVVEVEDAVQCVAWCPNPVVCLVAISVQNIVHLFNPKLGDKLVVSGTDKLIEDYKKPDDPKTLPQVEWEVAEGGRYDEGYRLSLKHFKPTRQVNWHGKGDYFSCVIPTGQRTSIVIHQLSKRRSQNPFKKFKGLIQCCSFHPTRPFLFVATQKQVRVYNLIKQVMVKKLITYAKWISSISIHPGGDNIIIGTYDCKLSWFDLDLSVTPYKTLRHHKQAIRSVCYHRRYPLFASASDDGTVIICHGQVYNDLLQNPLIVPVKVLKGHSITNGLGVLCCEFHPNQPWIFSSAADGNIRLFT